jgi:hypothetical protein
VDGLSCEGLATAQLPQLIESPLRPTDQKRAEVHYCVHRGCRARGPSLLPVIS